MHWFACIVVVTKGPDRRLFAFATTVTPMLDQNINFAALGLLGDDASGNNGNPDAVAIPEPTVAERVARLEARGIDDATIADMFQLTTTELAQLREDVDYAPALATGQQQQVERPLQIDDSWDDVENVALLKLRETVGNEYDPDRLIKIASLANRATRRSEKAKSGQLDASQAVSNIVQVSFSPTFIQQLQTMNPKAEHARIAKSADHKNMVDYLPQNEFEKVIQTNVNSDVADVAEDAVALLDTMVLGA